MSQAEGADKAQFVKPATITIDGVSIVAESGSNLLQVALENGIDIPHYCYHPKLSIDGSCRMCQVRVEKAPKLTIACNTPITDGMVVHTKTEDVAHARQGVMELLLVNHPIDCPICDQAGECFLQDYSFEYGTDESRTSSPRRKGVKRFPIGPRVVFDQERCILCRRCVRFTKEISKTDELRVFGIGDTSRIGTFPGEPLDNPYSINTADICPVGALLNADFHHKLRVWFLDDVESVCPSCANGCNVKVGVHKNQVWRLTPRRNDAVNDTWMCDHGRLEYPAVQDASRLEVARIRSAAPKVAEAAVRQVAIDEAIGAAADLVRSTKQQHGAGAIGIIGSGHLTNEECARLVALARDAIGTPHLDLVVPMGDADDLLIKAEKCANARGARDLGVSPGAGGRDAAAMLAGAAAGEIRLLIVARSADLAPVLGDAAVDGALAALEGLIVLDTNHSRVAERANVVLPGLTWVEKDGTFTNHAGRVQRIRKAITRREFAPCDGAILTRLAGAVGGTAAATFDPRGEFAALAKATPAFAGMTYDDLGSSGLAGPAAPPASPTEGA